MEDAPEKSGICHIPDQGEPDDVWWLGFDCLHGGDLAPGMMAFPELRGLETASVRGLGDVQAARLRTGPVRRAGGLAEGGGVKLDIDKENNIAYLAIGATRPKQVFHTVPIFDIKGQQLSLDFSKSGALLGIEFLNAKQQLPKGARSD